MLEGKTSLIKVLAGSLVPFGFDFPVHCAQKASRCFLCRVKAQHTERSIVNVPLARIKTNTELMQLQLCCFIFGRRIVGHLPSICRPRFAAHMVAPRIFDQKYTVEGIETPVRLRIKDVIFVMEVLAIHCAWPMVVRVSRG